MTTANVRLRVSFPNMAEVLAHWKNSPRIFALAMENAYTAQGKREIEESVQRQPPEVTRNVKDEWPSEKARRAANVSRPGKNWGRGRKYVRTGTVSQSWSTSMSAGDDSATLMIQNDYDQPNPYSAENFSALYVYGGPTPETRSLQQPMHTITGWFNAYDELVEAPQEDIARIAQGQSVDTPIGRMTQRGIQRFIQAMK